MAFMVTGVIFRLTGVLFKVKQSAWISLALESGNNNILSFKLSFLCTSLTLANYQRFLIHFLSKHLVNIM